jgi:hypothetical protein
MKRLVVLSFFLACSGVLLGDSPASRNPSHEPASPLQDLVRLTNEGLSEATILAYAKAHRFELPPEVSTDDLLWLRKSGVSETVVRYMTAIDVRASDAGAADVPAARSDRAAGYSAAADSYSDDSAYGSDYGGYPESYDNGYDPFFGGAYYPYPAYFFLNRDGFFERFHRRGHGFAGRRGHVIGHGALGRPRFSRGDFDRRLGRRRGSVVIGPRGPGRPAFPRGNLGQGLRGPRGVAVRNGGFQRRGFSGGGHAGGSFGRGPTAGSGGARGTIARSAGNRRR